MQNNTNTNQQYRIRINHYIRVPQVRVVLSDGTSPGIMDTRDALKLAQEQGSMRYPIWFLRIVVLLLLFGFTVRNAEIVTLHYYFGYEWQAPLVLIILLF